MGESKHFERYLKNFTTQFCAESLFELFLILSQTVLLKDFQLARQFICHNPHTFLWLPIGFYKKSCQNQPNKNAGSNIQCEENKSHRDLFISGIGRIWKQNFLQSPLCFDKLLWRVTLNIQHIWKTYCHLGFQILILILISVCRMSNFCMLKY